MHELSMIKRVLEIAYDVSAQHDNRPIRGITMEIGALQQIVPEALGFAFEAATTGTRADGAHLAWRLIPVEVLCKTCETHYEPSSFFWVCPHCGNTRGVPVRGNELNVVEVELLDSSLGEVP